MVLVSAAQQSESALCTIYTHSQSLSHVWLFGMLWTVVWQVLLSMGFPRQEYWSGLPFPPPGDLPDTGIELSSPMSPALQVDFFYLPSHQAALCVSIYPLPFRFLTLLSESWISKWTQGAVGITLDLWLIIHFWSWDLVCQVSSWWYFQHRNLLNHQGGINEMEWADFYSGLTGMASMLWHQMCYVCSLEDIFFIPSAAQTLQ